MLWSAHNGPRLGAALAYYAVLSLAPMLILMVAVCGRVFGEGAVRGEVYGQIKDVVGSQAAEIVQTMLKDAYTPSTGILATIAGSAVLLFGASGVFAELRDTLNFIWEAPVEPSSFGNIIRYRFFCFAMVSAVGFLLMLSLAVSTIIEAATRYITVPAQLLEVGNSMIGFLVFALLFALVFKIVPEVPISWRDVGPGAVVTAALFVAGKFVLAFYLGKFAVGSSYGAAGSLVVLLVWVYYSAQIFLYGAELTHLYARRTEIT